MWLLSNFRISPILLFSFILVVSVEARAGGESLADYQPVLPDEFKIALREASPESGEMLFMRKCSSCHDHEQSGGHGKGPHLWNLLNRKAGSMMGFDYSEAMSNIGVKWTFANLNYYLTKTRRAVPGLAMEFRGIRRDKDRVKLLAFLRTLHDTPPKLP